MQVFSTLLFCTVFETLLLVQILIQLDDLIFFYDFSKSVEILWICPTGKGKCCYWGWRTT